MEGRVGTDTCMFQEFLDNIMSWYKQSMATVWGRLASGIMFTYQGKVFLQLRSSDVEEGGVWGIPGGALKGTEGFYDSRLIPKPKITEQIIRNLWNSAIKEVEEEVGVNLQLTEDQYRSSKKIVKFLDNFPYITFVVEVTKEQFDILSEITLEDPENFESKEHRWFLNEDTPENLHPGVEYVFKNLPEKVDISAATIVKNLIVAEDKWTQDQVYIDEKKIVYDVSLLKKITKDNRVERAKVEDYQKQLYDKDVWAEGDRRISPMMVLMKPTYDHTYIKHMSKIRMCNLEDPILIRASNSRVIDGFHRLSKAFLIGKSRIKAVYVQEEQMKQAVVKE